MIAINHHVQSSHPPADIPDPRIQSGQLSSPDNDTWRRAAEFWFIYWHLITHGIKIPWHRSKTQARTYMIYARAPVVQIQIFSRIYQVGKQKQWGANLLRVWEIDVTKDSKTNTKKSSGRPEKCRSRGTRSVPSPAIQTRQVIQSTYRKSWRLDNGQVNVG